MVNSPVLITGNVDSINICSIVVWYKIISNRIVKVMVRIRTWVLNKSKIFLVVHNIWLDRYIHKGSFRLRRIRTVNCSICTIRNLSVSAPKLAVAGFPVRTSLTVDSVDNIPSPIKVNNNCLKLIWKLI